MATGITEYTGGFEYEEGERGITATRIFHYDPDSTVDNGIEVPSAGDALEFPMTLPTLVVPIPTDLDGLICRSRKVIPLAGHPGKFQWTCTYTNEPSDDAIFIKDFDNYDATAIENLPMNLEYSGEVMTIKPPVSAGWTWSDGSPCEQKMKRRINTATLRITRYIKDGDDYITFMVNVKNMGAHVNESANPFGTTIGGGPGCWLFIGVGTEFIRNNINAKWWKAELEFQFCDPDESNYEGWNKLMKEDGTFDTPKDKTSEFMYMPANFENLFKIETNVNP